MTYEDLKAIICIANVLVDVDGDSDQREMNSIVKSIRDAYDVPTDDLRQIFEAGLSMSTSPALERIRQLPDKEKRFASNLFGNVILADKQLTEKEKEVYWEVQRICGLPDFDPDSCHMDALQGSAPQTDTFPTPVFITASFDITTIGNIRSASILLWDLGDRPLTGLKSIFAAPGKPEPDFYTRMNTKVLKMLNKEMGLEDEEYQLSFVYDKHGGPFNKPLSYLNDGNAMYGTCCICLSNDKYYMKGFTQKAQVRFVMKALDVLSEHTCFVEAGDGYRTPSQEALLEEQQSRLDGVLSDVDNNKIHRV